MNPSIGYAAVTIHLASLHSRSFLKQINASVHYRVCYYKHGPLIWFATSVSYSNFLV
jgi:hypothetical protein